MILCKLFRGLGRPRALTSATPENFWGWAMYKKKIKKYRRSRPTPGSHLWSTRPAVRNTILGPKSAQEVKNQSWVWLFLEGSIVLLTTYRVCGDHREPPHGCETVRTGSCEIAQGWSDCGAPPSPWGAGSSRLSVFHREVFLQKMSRLQIELRLWS